MSKATSPVAFTPRGVNKNSFDALKMYLADMSDDEEGVALVSVVSTMSTTLQMADFVVVIWLGPDNDGEEDDSSGILVTESIVLEATGEVRMRHTYACVFLLGDTHTIAIFHAINRLTGKHHFKTSPIVPPQYVLPGELHECYAAYPSRQTSGKRPLFF